MIDSLQGDVDVISRGVHAQCEAGVFENWGGLSIWSSVTVSYRHYIDR
jgi:hypothetical protein